MSTIKDTETWLTLAREIGAEFAARVVADERDRIRPDAQLQRLKDSGLTNLVIPGRLGGAGQPGSLARLLPATARSACSLAITCSIR